MSLKLTFSRNIDTFHKISIFTSPLISARLSRQKVVDILTFFTLYFCLVFWRAVEAQLVPKSPRHEQTSVHHHDIANPTAMKRGRGDDDCDAPCFPGAFSPVHPSFQTPQLAISPWKQPPLFAGTAAPHARSKPAPMKRFRDRSVPIGA